MVTHLRQSRWRKAADECRRRQVAARDCVVAGAPGPPPPSARRLPRLGRGSRVYGSRAHHPQGLLTHQPCHHLWHCGPRRWRGHTCRSRATAIEPPKLVLRIARTTSLIRRSSPLSSAHSLPSRQVGLAEAGSSAASQPGLSVIDERGRPERAQPLGQATARPARPPHPPGDEHVRTGGPADPRGQDHQGGHRPPAWRIHGRHRRPVRARSLLSLMVLSVLMACPGLRYCLMRECL